MSASSKARALRGDFLAASRLVSRERASTLEGLDLVGNELASLIDTMGGQVMLDLVTEHTDSMHADAVSRAPAGKYGQYRQAIRQKVFDNEDGPKGSVFVVQGPWERTEGTTKWPKNVPLWIEYGTRKMDPRPHLIPAFHVARERFDRAFGRLLEAFQS